MAPKKNQKMSLGTFLQDENFGSWADEMEDMPLPAAEPRSMYGGDRRTGGFAPRGGDRDRAPLDRRDGYPPREQLPLPTQPPYTAHLANLSFDATQSDVGDFFRDCQVTNVRIVEDKLDRKPKGFGYVEFATLDGLKAALALTGSSLGGRQIRVSVAEPPKDRQESRDFSDWSRKGPLPDLPQTQRRVSDRPGPPNRNFDSQSDAGSERGGRRQYEQGDGKLRDFSNWERKGPLSPVTTGPTTLREGGRQGSKDGQNFRRNSPAWGEGQAQGQVRAPDTSRPRREFTEKPPVERQPTASEMDNQWRSRMRPDAPARAQTSDTSTPSSPAAAPPPVSRPRLNLQKRTVSEADPPALTSSGDSKSSPFGAARPVDTAAKEKEAEEKLQLALRQRKEADEKAKAEKAEEKKLAKEKADSEKANEVGTKEVSSPTQPQESEKEAPAQQPNFAVLRRADSANNDMVPEDEGKEDEDDAEPALPVEDKAVKPKEVIRQPAAGANGAWRKKGAAPSPTPAAAPATTEPTAAALEEDGWSTVSKPQKQRNNRRNNAPARAIAS